MAGIIGTPGRLQLEWVAAFARNPRPTSSECAVELDLLVKGQLAPFADTLGTRVGIHGPSLRLSAAAAQSIGMAVHELATNASKYGALSTPEGSVDLGWSQEGDTLTIAWTERGGPTVEKPISAGFGTFVLKGMAEQALNAVVVLEYASSGLQWRLITSLNSVIDDPPSNPAG